MLPWLWYGDAFRLPTYFTMLMVGLAVATFVLRREARRVGLEPRVAIDAAIVALPASLVGARLAHVLIEAPDRYLRDPWLALSPEAGFVFYGGFFGGLLALWSYTRRAGVSLGDVCDVFSPATAFGLVFGRLGCLGGGCCHGRPADWPFGAEVPWSVAYHTRGQLPDAWLALPLHPAPLYEAAGCVALFVVLCGVAARRRFAGHVLLAFLVGYGALRSVVEVFRADTERGLWLGGWVSTSQVVGLTTAVVALWLWRRLAATAADVPDPVQRR